MSAARIGILVLAVVAAGIAALLARGLIADKPATVEPKVVEAPTTEVLVAAQNLQLGQRVSATDLRWQKWPDASLNTAYLTRTQNPAALEENIGSVVRVALLGGEPVTTEKLVSLNGAGFMSALIEPGMRATAISITPETSAGGFILPNDRVDVIDASAGQSILRNIRVLAIDQRFSEREGEQVVVGKTATLELTPAQAELLAVAERRGTLILSLRSMGDQELAGNDRGDGEGGSVVKVVRYGSATSVRVK